MKFISYIILGIIVFGLIFLSRCRKPIYPMTSNERKFSIVYQVLCFSMLIFMIVINCVIGNGLKLYIFEYGTALIIIAIFLALEIIFVFIAKHRKIIFKSMIMDFVLIILFLIISLSIFIARPFADVSKVKLENNNKVLVLEEYANRNRTEYIIYERVNLLMIKKINNIRVYNDYDFIQNNEQGYETIYYQNGFALFFGYEYEYEEDTEGDIIIFFYKYNENNKIIVCQEYELIK